MAVQPHANYSAKIYKNDKNRASRIISRCGYEITSAQLGGKNLKIIGWQTKPHKCIKTHNLAPSYLSDKFLTRDTVHEYNTRGNSIQY